MKMFMVGGAVRDEIMGVKSKDIDFTVVLEEDDIPDPNLTVNPPSPFEIMVLNLQGMGFRIFLESPEFLTVRAQFPIRSVSDLDSMDEFGNVVKSKRLTADFVLARKEADYSDGRRPDTVEIGTLDDDLARRDLTMNAIAKDHQGNYIDPFGGRHDIAMGLIRAVGDPYDRLREDALRAVRVLRFSVTKHMVIEPGLRFAMQSEPVVAAVKEQISDERIKDELSKMFRCDTVASIQALNAYPALTAAMFAGSVSLDSTMKTRGRGR